MTRQLEDARAAGREQPGRRRAQCARLPGGGAGQSLRRGAGLLGRTATCVPPTTAPCTILNDPLDGYERRAPGGVDGPRGFSRCPAGRLAWPTEPRLATGRSSFPVPDGSAQTLLLHGTRLPDDTGGGWVVVFDDITQPDRRPAHGRLGRGGPAPRARDQEPADAHPAFGRASAVQARRQARRPTGRRDAQARTTTIVNQVEAMKNLVNAFRDYARLPAPQAGAARPQRADPRGAPPVRECSRCRSAPSLARACPGAGRSRRRSGR
jgi:hypothetical protein